MTCALMASALLATALAPAARADDGDDDGDDGDDDPDGDYAAFPRRSLAFGLYGHATHVAGHAEGGLGPTLELAYGRGRWQYVAEGSYASADRDPRPGGLDPDEMRIEGHVWRGALGARWLARQFRPDSSGGVELFLLSLVGLEHYHYAAGSKLTRPEIGLGVGIQGRVYSKPNVAFRLDLRLLFTPDDADSSLVRCRQLCSRDDSSSTGFMTGMAFAW